MDTNNHADSQWDPNSTLKHRSTVHSTDMNDDTVDYPAAHSMDTEWFAVDKDGCVALMKSDEPGAVPDLLGDNPQDCDWWGILEALAGASGCETDEFGGPKPDAVGFFHYQCKYIEPPEIEEFDGYALPPYTRVAAPKTPVKLAELPADISAQLKYVKFESVAFTNANLLQPAAHTRCKMWHETDLCFDDNGKVQPIPATYPDDHLQEQSKKPVPDTHSPDTSQKPWWKKFFGW